MGIVSLLRGRDFLLTPILSISVRRNGNVHGYCREYLYECKEKGACLNDKPTLRVN